MSRIGQKPINLPLEVKIEVLKNHVSVTGPKGEASLDLPPKIMVKKIDQEIQVLRTDESNKTKALHGLARSLLNNMIIGVKEGYEKKLVLQGVGFSAEIKDGDLVLHVGFSHPVAVSKKEAVEFRVEKNIITVWGIDKQKVGQVAAQIRSIQPPEPYKGKGIRYEGEVVKLKPGKQAKATVVS